MRYLFYLMVTGMLCGLSASVPATTQTLTSDVVDTSTDFLSDDDWRRLPREVRRARSRGSMLARYEPSGKPTIERLPDYLLRFQEVNIYDGRLFQFKVKAEHVTGTTGSVVLSGEVSQHQLKSGLESTLKDLGFNVTENTIDLLPAQEVLDEPYAISITSAATMRKEPRSRAEQVNSVGLGGTMRLLRVARTEDLTTTSPGRGSRGATEPVAETDPGQWYLAQSLEGYIGFVRKHEIERTTNLILPDAILTKPTTVTAESRQVVLPAGSFVNRRGHTLSVAGKWTLPSDVAVSPAGSPAFTADEVLELMQPFMDTHYVWGGVTHEGIDCSGFTQFLWRSRGIFLPRDAEEQAVVGQIVAWGEDVDKAAKPGDLIFFLGESGKVVHVGISLGEGRMIHSSSGAGVHVVSLRDSRREDGSSGTHLDRTLYARRVQGR